MKAKEYAAQYNQSPTIETLTEIASAFLMECTTIAETRNARSNAAMISIFNEQDLKWKAFARLVEGVKPEGFENALKFSAYEAWEQWRGKGKQNDSLRS